MALRGRQTTIVLDGLNLRHAPKLGLDAIASGDVRQHVGE